MAVVQGAIVFASREGVECGTFSPDKQIAVESD